MKITCLLICSFFLFGCNLRPSVRGNEGALQTKTESVEETAPSDQVIDFEGVSFHYDPRVFGDVKKEVIPERKLKEPNDKPGWAQPQSTKLEFEFGDEDIKTRIEVYRLDMFDDAYAISPRMVEYINDRIAGLRKVLKDPSFRLQNEIPELEYSEATRLFYVKVRDFDFPSGSGIVFVTAESIEPELISNRNLVYRFEGITTDGKYYVIAEMPVSVAFLPDASPNEFEGYTDENLYKGNLKAAEAKIEKYRSSISTRLEKLTPNDYSPNLEKFETIISSLKINK